MTDSFAHFSDLAIAPFEDPDLQRRLMLLFPDDLDQGRRGLSPVDRHALPEQPKFFRSNDPSTSAT